MKRLTKFEISRNRKIWNKKKSSKQIYRLKKIFFFNLIKIKVKWIMIHKMMKIIIVKVVKRTCRRMAFVMTSLNKMVIRVTIIKTTFMIKKKNKIPIQLMEKKLQITKKICLRLILILISKWMNLLVLTKSIKKSYKLNKKKVKRQILSKTASDRISKIIIQHLK